MNRGRSYLTSVGFAAAGLTFIAPAVAQEVSGLTATFGIKQSIEASDNLDLGNPANSGARGVTQLSFGLVSETRTSRLGFDTAGKFEFDEDGVDFTDPSASFSYMTATRNSQLAFRANYAETDINALTSVFADTGGFGLVEQLVVGTGTRLRNSANLRFETGIDAPLGLILDGRFDATDFRDTSDPDLFETERLTFGATVRMRVNSSVSMRFGVELEGYEAQDDSNTIRDNQRIFWASDFDIRPDLSATTQLSYSRNETTTTNVVGGFGLTGIENVDTDEGFGGGFAITKTLKDGTIGADFDTRVTSDGRRDTVRVTRVLNLPRGAFSLSLGAVKTEASSAQPLVDMTYRQEMPRGLVTLGLRQQASISDDDETLINTRLRASYNEEINASSSWGLTALLADSDAVDFDDDSRRLDLGVDYRRELARDWDLVANYTYSMAEDSGDASRTSNTVSLSIEKAFQFKP
jgi:hypothetical protein